MNMPARWVRGELVSGEDVFGVEMCPIGMFKRLLQPRYEGVKQVTMVTLARVMTVLARV